MLSPYQTQAGEPVLLMNLGLEPKIGDIPKYGVHNDVDQRQMVHDFQQFGIEFEE